jgi:hypothetical protein
VLRHDALKAEVAGVLERAGSAVLSEADIRQSGWDVRKVPTPQVEVNRRCVGPLKGMLLAGGRADRILVLDHGEVPSFASPLG